MSVGGLCSSFVDAAGITHLFGQGARNASERSFHQSMGKLPCGPDTFDWLWTLNTSTLRSRPPMQHHACTHDTM